MDVDTFRAVHGYGAILSLVATAVAGLAYVVRGPDSFVGLLFGFLGPLAGFYFCGAVLQDASGYRVLGDELLRGVVWYGGSLFGWSIVVTSSNAVPATPFTTLGLPALTALGLTFAMVALRRVTGLDLKVQTAGGRLLVAVTGAIVGGFVVLYLVLVDGRSPWLGPVYVLATVAGLVLWRYHWRGQRTEGTGSM